MLSIQVNNVTYDLPVQTDELQSVLDDLYDNGRLSELIDPHSMLASVRPNWPTPPATPWPRPRLGSIYWPIVGLAHYAFATLLVDEYTLGQIRLGLTAAGHNGVLLKLTDDPDDPDEVAREVPLHFLATRPLVRTTSDPLTTTNNATDPVDAWVMVLVDGRYAAVSGGVVFPQTSSWADLIGAFWITGITISDAVDTDYLLPNPDRWVDQHQVGRSKAWLADIAALSVGSRIVVTPNSNPIQPTVQRPTATRLAALTDRHAEAVAAGRFIGGGPILAADLIDGMPPTVLVYFGATDYDANTEVVSVTGGAGGFINVNVVTWADPSAATDSGERSALAAQWDEDWRAWQSELLDATYTGFVEAPESGYCWAVEWFHSAGKGYTKFVRPPHWYGYLGAPGQPAFPNLTVQDVVNVSSIQFDADDGFIVTNDPFGSRTARVDLEVIDTIDNFVVRADGPNHLQGGAAHLDDDGTLSVSNGSTALTSTLIVKIDPEAASGFSELSFLDTGYFGGGFGKSAVMQFDPGVIEDDTPYFNITVTHPFFPSASTFTVSPNGAGTDGFLSCVGQLTVSGVAEYKSSSIHYTLSLTEELYLIPTPYINPDTMDDEVGLLVLRSLVGTSEATVIAERYAIGDNSGIEVMGKSGALGPGCIAKNGLIISVGSGSFVGTGTVNAFTNTNTFTAPAAGSIPVTITGAFGQTANLFVIEADGGSDLFTVSAAGVATATSFSGSGAGLTALPAGELTGIVDGGTW